jgi:hypothetical protein
MPETATFRVSLPGVGPGEDVFGVWQAHSAPFAKPEMWAGSFGTPTMAAGREPDEEEPATLWQVDLPDDSRRSSNLLALQEERLAQAEQALPLAERRLERYIESRRRGAGSFSGGRRGSPEAGLDAWLGPVGAAAFGGLPGLPEDFEAAVRQANALFKSLTRAAAYAAWVETSTSGRLVGRTTVAWDGDLRHFLQRGAAEMQVIRHQQNLILALRSRIAWIKMTVLVLTGGFKLALLAPTGPLGTILPSLQFFRQVIAEAQEIQSLH